MKEAKKFRRNERKEEIKKRNVKNIRREGLKKGERRKI